jgi:hypothetical protein
MPHWYWPCGTGFGKVAAEENVPGNLKGRQKASGTGTASQPFFRSPLPRMSQPTVSTQQHIEEPYQHD